MYGAVSCSKKRHVILEWQLKNNWGHISQSPTTDWLNISGSMQLPLIIHSIKKNEPII